MLFHQTVKWEIKMKILKLVIITVIATLLISSTVHAYATKEFLKAVEYTCGTALPDCSSKGRTLVSERHHPYAIIWALGRTQVDDGDEAMLPEFPNYCNEAGGMIPNLV